MNWTVWNYDPSFDSKPRRESILTSECIKTLSRDKNVNRYYLKTNNNIIGRRNIILNSQTVKHILHWFYNTSSQMHKDILRNIFNFLHNAMHKKKYSDMYRRYSYELQDPGRHDTERSDLQFHLFMHIVLQIM